MSTVALAVADAKVGAKKTLAQFRLEQLAAVSKPVGAISVCIGSSAMIRTAIDGFMTGRGFGGTLFEVLNVLVYPTLLSLPAAMVHFKLFKLLNAACIFSHVMRSLGLLAVGLGMAPNAEGISHLLVLKMEVVLEIILVFQDMLPLPILVVLHILREVGWLSIVVGRMDGDLRWTILRGIFNFCVVMGVSVLLERRNRRRYREYLTAWDRATLTAEEDLRTALTAGDDADVADLDESTVKPSSSQTRTGAGSGSAVKRGRSTSGAAEIEKPASASDASHAKSDVTTSSAPSIPAGVTAVVAPPESHDWMPKSRRSIDTAGSSVDVSRSDSDVVDAPEWLPIAQQYVQCVEARKRSHYVSPLRQHTIRMRLTGVHPHDMPHDFMSQLQASLRTREPSLMFCSLAIRRGCVVMTMHLLDIQQPRNRPAAGAAGGGGSSAAPGNTTVDARQVSSHVVDALSEVLAAQQGGRPRDGGAGSSSGSGSGRRSNNSNKTMLSVQVGKSVCQYTWDQQQQRYAACSKGAAATAAAAAAGVNRREHHQKPGDKVAVNSAIAQLRDVGRSLSTMTCAVTGQGDTPRQETVANSVAGARIDAGITRYTAAGVRSKKSSNSSIDGFNAGIQVQSEPLIRMPDSGSMECELPCVIPSNVTADLLIAETCSTTSGLTSSTNSSTHVLRKILLPSPKAGVVAADGSCLRDSPTRGPKVAMDFKDTLEPQQEDTLLQSNEQVVLQQGSDVYDEDIQDLADLEQDVCDLEILTADLQTKYRSGMHVDKVIHVGQKTWPEEAMRMQLSCTVLLPPCCDAVHGWDAHADAARKATHVMKSGVLRGGDEGPSSNLLMLARSSTGQHWDVQVVGVQTDHGYGASQDGHQIVTIKLEVTVPPSEMKAGSSSSAAVVSDLVCGPVGCTLELWVRGYVKGPSTEGTDAVNAAAAATSVGDGNVPAGDDEDESAMIELMQASTPLLVFPAQQADAAAELELHVSAYSNKPVVRRNSTASSETASSVTSCGDQGGHTDVLKQDVQDVSISSLPNSVAAYLTDLAVWSAYHAQEVVAASSKRVNPNSMHSMAAKSAYVSIMEWAEQQSKLSAEILGHGLLMYTVRKSMPQLAEALAKAMEGLEAASGNATGTHALSVSVGVAGKKRVASAWLQACMQPVDWDGGSASDGFLGHHAAPQDLLQKVANDPEDIAQCRSLLHAAALSNSGDMMAVVMRWALRYGGSSWALPWQLVDGNGFTPLHLVALQSSCGQMLHAITATLGSAQQAAAHKAWVHDAGGIQITPQRLQALTQQVATAAAAAHEMEASWTESKKKQECAAPEQGANHEHVSEPRSDTKLVSSPATHGGAADDTTSVTDADAGTASDPLIKKASGVEPAACLTPRDWWSLMTGPDPPVFREWLTKELCSTIPKYCAMVAVMYTSAAKKSIQEGALLTEGLTLLLLVLAYVPMAVSAMMKDRLAIGWTSWVLPVQLARGAVLWLAACGVLPMPSTWSPATVYTSGVAGELLFGAMEMLPLPSLLVARVVLAFSFASLYTRLGVEHPIRKAILSHLAGFAASMAMRALQLYRFLVGPQGVARWEQVKKARSQRGKPGRGCPQPVGGSSSAGTVSQQLPAGRS